MALHWILLFVAVILVGLIAWHSTRFSTSSLRKVFNRRSQTDTDEVLGLGGDEEKPSAPASSGVICLNIRAPEGEAFVGEGLVGLLRNVGMYFGEMSIFHYELERDGDFFPVFSLASAFEPGSFNLDTIDGYMTPGLTLFMEIDAVDNPREVFEIMINTTRTIADALQGIVCDDKWVPLTDETLARYQARL